MITVTIEGPKGSGKTKIGRAIEQQCDSEGKRCLRKEEVTDAALIKFKDDIDVLIIEKQT